MSLFRKSIKITMSTIVLIVLIVLLIVSIYLYSLTGNTDSLCGVIFGGLASGLIVAIIQFIIAWQDYKQTEILKELKLIKVMYNRASREQYEDYIRSTNRELDVMGVTAVRFFNDFADTSKGAPDNATVLIKALERGVNVRVLVASDIYLPDTKKADYEKVKAKYLELAERYSNLKVQYYNHTPTHSIFRMDDDCVIGPVFPNLESRNTPALHVKRSSPMALNYMDYFETEWREANKA